MDIICEQSKCTGCGLCRNVCPTGAIEMIENQEGFLFPLIKKEKCINCSKCSKRCPVNAKIMRNTPLSVKAGYANDERIAMHSSSGGAFSCLANIIFRNNGVVAGVYYDSADGELKHGIAKNKEELNLMRLSKYYQSNTGEIYSIVSDYLKKHVLVLFTGTACQIAAIQSFVSDEEREYLITADILCHGVTNSKVVKSYLQSKEKKYKSTIKDFFFRIKSGKKGWYGGGGARMRLVFVGDRVVDTDNQTDTYFVGFNNSLFLRNCCDARITRERFYSGVSLILVNTIIAEKYINELNEEMTMMDADIELAVSSNRSLKMPYLRHKDRENFFTELSKEKDFDGIIRRIFWKYYIDIYVRRLLRMMVGNNGYEKLKKILKG